MNVLNKVMIERPQRKTEHLIKGRISIPHARYFITLCTKDRKPGLTEPILAGTIRETWRKQHAEKDYTLHCATIMPDHIHWLFTLGERLSLSQVISKFKSLTPIQQDWQRNYFDHRLRAEDAKEPFSKYIFLNPYRKRLIQCDETWPWWTLSRHEKPEFIEHFIDGKSPPPEWINQGPQLKDLVKQDTALENEVET